MRKIFGGRLQAVGDNLNIACFVPIFRLGGGGGRVHRSIGIFTSRGHAQSILRNLQMPGPGPGRLGAQGRGCGRAGRKGGGSARRTAARENYFFLR